METPSAITNHQLFVWLAFQSCPEVGKDALTHPCAQSLDAVNLGRWGRSILFLLGSVEPKTRGLLSYPKGDVHMGLSGFRVSHHWLTFQLELEHTPIGTEPQTRGDTSQNRMWSGLTGR